MKQSDFQKLVGDIDWAELPGAYGPSFALAEHLVACASSDESEAYRALGRVMGHVCHQNTLSMPAPETAACLLRIPEVEDAHAWVGPFGVVYLLTSAWSQTREFGFRLQPLDFAGRTSPSAEVQKEDGEAYDALSTRVRQALDSASDLLRAMLDHSDPRTRAQSARLLALTRTEDHLAHEALLKACDRERNDAVRGGLLLALACRSSRVGCAPSAELLAQIRGGIESGGTLERMSAAAALLLLDPGECLAQHLAVIQDGLRFSHDQSPHLFIRSFPWSLGVIADLMADALTRASVPDEQVMEPALEALQYWDSNPNESEYEVEWSELELIAMRVLRRAFREHLSRRDYLTSRDLSPLQRSLVAQLAPLAIDGDVFAPYGVRDLASDADRLLGRASGGLDQDLSGEWEGHSVRWPLWKWWHQAALIDYWSGDKKTVARDQVLSRMRCELKPRTIFQAAEDAATGAYAVPPAPLVRMVAELADQLLPELEKYVAGLDEKSSGEQAALAVLPSLTLAAAGKEVPWLERIRPWLGRIAPKELQTAAAKVAASE